MTYEISNVNLIREVEDLYKNTHTTRTHARTQSSCNSIIGTTNGPNLEE